MGPYIETFIESTRKVATPAALKKLFLGAVSDQGYENVVFARTNNRRLVSVPWSEFPPGYLDTYRAEEWDRIDPVVQRVHSVRGPFKWCDSSPMGGFSRQQRHSLRAVVSWVCTRASPFRSAERVTKST